MNILVSAAKTGGHVFPAIAIGDELIKRGHQVIFLGSGAEIETNALRGKKFSYYQISMTGFRGKSILNKISTLFLIPLNILKTIQILRKERIDAMIGFGGFITLPPAFAFLIMGKPIFTHEQNSVIGSANKVLSKFSKINFIAFPTISNIKNTFVSGNPIRTVFTSITDNKIRAEQEIRIYVTGGSQGAEYINLNVPKCFKEFNKYLKIKHQCGKDKINQVKNLYSGIKVDAEVKEFYDNPQFIINWADFVITRSGALSISEISSMSRGMLMIPLPSSIDNHQFFNAKYIEGTGMGIIHNQSDKFEILNKKLSDIIEQKTYNKWKEKNNLEHINAATKIVDEVIKYISK